LPGVDGLVPYVNAVSRDYKTVPYPRQIGYQILGDSVGKALLFRVIAKIGKWQ
jgi:hypothetical protein